MPLCQRQRHAALLQVGCTAAPRQGGLEHRELLGEVRPRWGGLTRRWWACRWLARCCRYRALPAGWRPPEGRLALLLLAPSLAGLYGVGEDEERETTETKCADR